MCSYSPLSLSLPFSLSFPSSPPPLAGIFSFDHCSIKKVVMTSQHSQSLSIDHLGMRRKMRRPSCPNCNGTKTSKERESRQIGFRQANFQITLYALACLVNFPPQVCQVYRDMTYSFIYLWWNSAIVQEKLRLSLGLTQNAGDTKSVISQ